MRLQDEMAGTENRITVARRRYNEAVAAYNQKAGSFPTALARSLLGFPASKPYFRATPDAQRTPEP
jgi:LemA protein